VSLPLSAIISLQVMIMKRLLIEVGEELLTVLKGRTLDALIPPILFFILYETMGLPIALIVSLISNTTFFIFRLSKRDNIVYAIGGFIGILFASIFTLISRNASNYFLPDIIGTSVLILITILSILYKKPVAAYLSHLTRGWTWDWFMRDDVRPAYMEVSVFWLSFLVARLGVEVYLYINYTVSELVWANVILGLPITLLILTISYIYGMWRLHHLKGPGIDEFDNKTEPPYRGQRRGF
jgi:hypothetical protein